jgi:hypothetical protein
VTPRRAALASLAIVLFAAISRPQERAADPFALFGAAGRLSAGDRRDLRAGRTLVRMLEESDKSHVGVFVAARIDVTPSRFAERVSNSAALWKGDAVPATGTFSAPARPEDVAELTLPRKDVDALRDCRPGDCLVKLAGQEIQRLRAVIAARPATWREDVQGEFRRVVLDRLAAYRRGGADGLPPFHDHADPVDPAAAFARLFAAAGELAAHEPKIAAYLQRYPQGPLPAGAHDYVYWVSTSETPRPTVQALHAIVHKREDGGAAEVVVVSRQVFATHYINGSLAITALLRDPADPAVRYMAYLNRSAVDGLGGLFSGLKRFFIERRIRGAAKSAFERLKQRIAA